MKKKKKIREKKFYLSDLVLLPICIIFLYPFYYMVINTFKTMSEMSFSPTAFPTQLFLDNYKDILTNLQIYRAFGITAVITVCSVLAIVVIGEMAAYPLAFRASKLDKAFTIYLMIGFLVPFQAILLSLFEVMQTLHLIDSVAGMSGKTLGAQAGSSGYDAFNASPKILKDIVANQKAVQYSTFTQALIDLDSGRIDGLLIDRVYANYYLEKSGVLDQYNVMPAGYEGESFAVGARKADKTLIKKINQGFRTLYKNGEFQKISNKWFGEDVATDQVKGKK